MKDFPVIKITIFFIIGILFQKAFAFQTTYYFLLIPALIMILILILCSSFKNVLGSFVTAIIIVLAGNFIAEVYAVGEIFLPEKLNYVKDFSASGKVENIELNKEQGIIFYLATDSVKFSYNNYKIRTKLLCKIIDPDKKKLDSIYSSMNIGNMVSIIGNYSKGNEQRNPGEFDYNNYLHLKGISGVLNCYDSKKFNITDKGKNYFKSFLFEIRKIINNKITALHSPQAASLVKGLLLADRSEISSETKTDFINSGVMHVLAVSGLHVGYIIIIFYFLFGRLNIYFRSFMILLGLVLFSLLTGLPSSVVRAVIMASVIIISQLTNRNTNLFNSLALAALIILLFSPTELFNPSFQLSFAAVISIAAIAPFFQTRINQLKINSNVIKDVLLFISISLSAQIGTLPFTLTYFSKLSLASLLANLLVIPTIGIVLAIGLFTLALSAVSPMLATLAATANNFVTSFLFSFVNLIGECKYSFIFIRGFSFIDSLVFYLLIAILFLYYKYFTKALSKIIFLSLILFDILLYSSFDQIINFPKNLFGVFMIDVGQGDAFLLHFPNGSTAIVDAGVASSYFDSGEKIIEPIMNYYDIPKINYAFISHIDLDHYGGIISLIQNGRIEKIFLPVVDTASEKEMRFLNFIVQNKIQYEYYSKKYFSVGNSRIYFLNDTLDSGSKRISSNNRSGVIKIVYGKTSFLFTGDIDLNGEKNYGGKYKTFLSADVLKISHHGSDKSSGEKFINAVKPRFSLISVGFRNKFGHPSTAVLNRLKKIDSEIFRTDMNGGILLCSNGENVYSINWH